MVQLTTLEEFLEYFCGMAPPSLVLHFIEHREWVENQLSIINNHHVVLDSEYVKDVEDLWLLLPDPPSEFSAYEI